MRKLIVIFLPLILLISCDFKPKYCRPTIEMYDSWRFQSPSFSEDCANLRWWEQFGDPVLNDLILAALENNQDLMVATSRVLQFYANYRVVASQLLPQVAGQASYLREELSDALNYAPVLPEVRVNSVYNIALNLSYELDFFGKIRNASQAACSEYLAQIEARRTVILSLISSVAGAYVQLRQYDAQLKISKMTLRSRLEYWKLAQLRYEIGLTSEMEVMQAISTAQSAEADVQRYEELIALQEDLISVLIGNVPEAIPRGHSLIDLKDYPCVPAGLPSELLENRPDILQAELLLLAANAQIGVARASFFPSISLTGLYGAESTSLSKLFKEVAKTWDLAFSAVQPIFTGWELTYNLKEAQAVKMEAIHTYLQTILTAFQEVDDALISHQKNQEIVVIETKRVAALTEYLKLAFLRYNNGQNDYLTVLDAERTLFQSQLDLAQARANVLLSLIATYKALGGGWVVDADYCLTKTCP